MRLPSPDDGTRAQQSKLTDLEHESRVHWGALGGRHLWLPLLRLRA